MLRIKYYDFYKNCKDIFETRLKMVNLALKIGIKPTSRKFGTTVKIVKKWVKRYNEEGVSALKNKSRKPNTSPNAMYPFWKFKILELCKKAKESNTKINVSKMKREYDIPYSIPSIIKVIDNNGYSKIIKKKNNAVNKSQPKKEDFDDNFEDMYREYIRYMLR